MNISSDIVGLQLKEYRTGITWRQTTNYAAAVGDMNPCFVDDCREAGIIAHPMFAVALSWPIVQNLYDYVKLPFPPATLQTMVHYTECLDFNRPIQPGDKLVIRGTVAAVTPEKSGTHIVFKFAAFDQEEEPVYTEYTGAMLRGVGCDGLGRALPGVPGIGRGEDSQEHLWVAEVPISKEAPYIYDGCTNIVFGIHTSPRFAKSVGLPGILLQGTATLALAVSQVINREMTGEVTGIRSIRARFTGMVFPDSAIQVQLTKREMNDRRGELSFQVLNQHGQKAISDGCLVVG